LLRDRPREVEQHAVEHSAAVRGIADEQDHALRQVTTESRRISNAEASPCLAASIRLNATWWTAILTLYTSRGGGFPAPRL